MNKRRRHHHLKSNQCKKYLRISTHAMPLCYAFRWCRKKNKRISFQFNFASKMSPTQFLPSLNFCKSNGQVPIMHWMDGFKLPSPEFQNWRPSILLTREFEGHSRDGRPDGRRENSSWSSLGCPCLVSCFLSEKRIRRPRRSQRTRTSSGGGTELKEEPRNNS